MTDSSVSVLHELQSSSAFVAAIKELIAVEVGARTMRLRDLLRRGDFHAATVTEGEISALEEVPLLLASCASKYSTNRF